MMTEGLNIDMTEEMFLRRFRRFKDGRYDFGPFGIVGIKFNYKEQQDKYVAGGTRLVSCGNVFLAFAYDWLALLFQADFYGHVGGDLQQWNRAACAAVKLADAELSKPPAHV